MGKLKQLFMDYLGRMPDNPGYRFEGTAAWRLGMTAEHGEGGPLLGHRHVSAVHETQEPMFVRYPIEFGPPLEIKCPERINRETDAALRDIWRGAFDSNRLALSTQFAWTWPPEQKKKGGDKC